MASKPMEVDIQRPSSSRLSRRGDRTFTQDQHLKDNEDDAQFSSKHGGVSDYFQLRNLWKLGFARLVLAAGITWMLITLFVLLIHLWSCQSSSSFLSGLCSRGGKVYSVLNTMGFVSPQHRCPIPVAYNPEKISIPTERTSDSLIKVLTYITKEETTNPVFGGNISWSEREESFKIKSSMKIHCGFIAGGGAEMRPFDIEYAHKCRFVVASGIFDGYDVPHQPSNLRNRSKKLFCFLMVVDGTSLDFIKGNVSVREDSQGGQWVGIWRIILLKNSPYDEPRRNGKVPKILTHRLFPQAQYSIWIDGKMELIVDPLLILERYLWRGKNTFAIAQHKHHRNLYEEADANKRRKRYARPLIDLHMKIYFLEGMKPWSANKGTLSDVPEGAIIVREHTNLNNLFSCLWFNEVHLFTPRDQLSFGYVVYRLGKGFKYFMFPNCEYNSLFLLHAHTREHSSKVEWVKSLIEFKGKGSVMRESKGGFGLWTKYPGDLDSVILPQVVRTSKAG